MAKNSPIKTFVFQLIKAGIGTLTIVLLSRWMGAEGRGVLGLLLFYVNLIMVLNEYVGGSSLANLTARYPLSRILPAAWIWACISLVVGGTVLYLVSGNSLTVMRTLIMAVPLAFLTIQYNVYQGQALVYRRNLFQLLVEVIKLILVVYFAILAFSLNVKSDLFIFDTAAVLTPNEVSVIYGLASAFVLLISILLWLPKLINKWPHLSLQKPPMEIFKVGFWAQNGQLVQFLNYRLSIVLITELMGDAAPAGVYSNALLIADTVWILGNSFGVIAHMRILQSKNKRFQAEITLRYAVISVAGTAIALFAILLVPQSFFVAIFGLDFVQLKSTTIWLFPAILALGASTLFSHYLHAVDQFKSLLVANLVGLIVQTTTGILLIPSMGLLGACIAANLGFLVILVVVYSMFKKQNREARIHGAFRLKAIARLLFRF